MTKRYIMNTDLDSQLPPNTGKRGLVGGGETDG